MTSIHNTDSTGLDGSAGWFVGLWKWSGEDNELLKIQGGSARAEGTGAIASLISCRLSDHSKSGDFLEPQFPYQKNGPNNYNLIKLP